MRGDIAFGYVQAVKGLSSSPVMLPAPDSFFQFPRENDCHTKNNYNMLPHGCHLLILTTRLLILFRFVFFSFSPLTNCIPHIFRGESVLLLPFYLRVEGTVA